MVTEECINNRGHKSIIQTSLSLPGNVWKFEKKKKRRPVIPLVRSREKKYSQKNDDESAEKDQKNHPKLGQKDEEHPEEDDGSKWKNSG